MLAETSVPPPISFPLPRKKRLFTTFELVIVLLGLLALAYLISTLMRPALVAQLLGASAGAKVATSEMVKPVAPEPSRDLLGGFGQIVAKQQGLGELKEIPAPKPEAELQSERDAAMAARVAALQEAPNGSAQAPRASDPEAERVTSTSEPANGANGSYDAPPTAASAQAPSSAPPAPRMAEVDLPPTPGALVTGSVANEPAEAGKTPPAATVINAPSTPSAPAAEPKKATAPPAAKTAAKDAAPKQPKAAAVPKSPAATPTKVAAASPSPGGISFGPAVVSKAKEPPEIVGIKIGRFGSIDDARLRWLQVTAGNADAVAGLEGRYAAAVGDDGAAYEVVAGPINSAAEARKVCKTLQSRAIECSVGPFIGNAL